MSKRISRSTFLTCLGGTAVAAAGGKLVYEWLEEQHRFPCRMLGPSRDVGHMLRRPRSAGEAHGITSHEQDGQEQRLPGNPGPQEGRGESSSPIEAEAVDVVIVGGGIAGLSAGWWLKRNGLKDFRIIELEPSVGGNSRSGQNAYSAYPWGAHYVPIPNPESEYVRKLFAELKVITGFDKNNQPLYDELYLCHEPQERLFKDGSFQDGLVPKRGLQPVDHEQMERFFILIAALRSRKGKDGKPAFAIPVDLSSSDPEFTSLDEISMADWLVQQKFDSRPLRWYLNYCCRDDYGSTLENVSAWAGIHYFAGRNGTAANAEPNAVLTWPEGNGFLVNKFKKYLDKQIIANNLVTGIHQRAHGNQTDGGNQAGENINGSDWNCEVSVYNTKSKCERRFTCRKVVFAAPRFIAGHVIADFKSAADSNSCLAELQYAPWMVANISVRRIPAGAGVNPCWDNVSYYSDSLGYVVASHQEISTRTKPSVLTYYYPLSAKPPSSARLDLMKASADQWSAEITADLEKMHPGITRDILSMDLWPWGHGMVRPSRGFIWGESRRKMKEPLGDILFAHSDMSGMSNFEEANYHGVQAASAILKELKATS